MRFLVCTDVAARGIDIKGLPYCINLTLPDKDEDYLHRVGCQGGGRAGSTKLVAHGGYCARATRGR